MTKTTINHVAAGVERVLGRQIKRQLRRFGTGVLTPISWSLRSGHFQSSLREKAVTSGGDVLPWFTYPAIDFLLTRDFSDCSILEFGGGQSTKFWDDRSRKTTTFELDDDWIDYIRGMVSDRVTLIKAPEDHATQSAFVSERLEAMGETFDVIIVDGLHRAEMFRLAAPYLKDTGLIICDNAEGYGFHAAWQDFPDLMRVDFYGHCPGVYHPHLTTIHFSADCAHLSAATPAYHRAYALNNMPYTRA